MSYPNHPGYPPGSGPPPRKPISWPGYVLGAIFGAPAVAGLVAGLDYLARSVSTQLGGIVGALSMLLLVGIPVGLIIPERTRPWGIGILIGFALWAIVAAGACIVVLAMLVHGESNP